MKKLMNKKGFTLMEMLIVVAIIVILVAISVPTFTANLGEAKTATDAANFRAAKSAAQVFIINNTPETGKVYYYSADKGDVVAIGSYASVTEKYGACSKHKDGYIKVSFSGTTVSAVEWSVNGDADCE